MNKLPYSKLSFLLFLLILVPSSFAVGKTSQKSEYPLPTIDGSWAPNEWPDSIIHTYQFNDFSKVQFAYRINSTYIFMTAKYYDSSPSFYNKTCANSFYVAFNQPCSDAFAVGFDINGDGLYMGSKSSPDDAIFVGMYGNYSIDCFMQGIGNKVFFDTEVNGTNDTFARYSYSSDHYFTFEMMKKLHSGDTNGHDIELHVGSSINVMLAYWNNLPPRIEISGYTARWIKLDINDQLNPTPSVIDYLPPIFIAFVVVLAVVAVKIISEFY